MSEKVPFSGKTHRGVVESLRRYAERNNINLADALCRALLVLGAAGEWRGDGGQPFHVPAAKRQAELFYWGSSTYLGQAINLATLGGGIDDEVVDLPPKKVTIEAANAYAAYCKSQGVGETQALAAAVYLLLLIEPGDLGVREKGGKVILADMIFASEDK